MVVADEWSDVAEVVRALAVMSIVPQPKRNHEKICDFLFRTVTLKPVTANQRLRA